MSDFNNFIDLIYSIKDRALLDDFLIAVTTESERKEFPKRVDIINMLLKGHPQHKIAAELGVGVSTVGRGSKELAEGRFKALSGRSQ